MSFGAKACYRAPGPFKLVRLLGSDYFLRCVVFHHISAEDSPFTRGINVRTSPAEFENALQFIAANYTPIRLDDLLASDAQHLPARPILVTFDDAYASVVNIAVPLCKKYDVPSVFFVNAAFVDNQRLAADNLVCYAASTQGMAALNTAAREVTDEHNADYRSVTEVFRDLFPRLTLVQRRTFAETLRKILGIDETRLAEEFRLYLSSSELRTLASFDCEIGNHTYSHVHCRKLYKDEFAEEIDRNKAALESVSGTKVRAFSQPYGSSVDLTAELSAHLAATGHRVAFLSESVANSRGSGLVFDRINPQTKDDAALFSDIEVLPRLRAARNRMLSRPRTSPESGVDGQSEPRAMHEHRVA